MTSMFRHNKKRNTALVYEFLVRRLGMTLVDKDADSYLKTVGIVKRYFSPGQPLTLEKEIYDVVTSARGVSPAHARALLDEAKIQIQKLDHRKIDIKKSNLIKEVHYAFGQDFFDIHRIPQYRLLASVSMLLENYKRPGTITESAQRLQLEENLVSYMTSKQPSQTEQRLEKVDTLVATLAMKKFEERYSGTLNEGQKKTLRKFMNFSMTGNREQFDREMNEEKRVLLDCMKSHRDDSCFSSDNVMLERMNEAIEKLSSLDDLVSESSVEEILLFHRLREELESND